MVCKRYEVQFVSTVVVITVPLVTIAAELFVKLPLALEKVTVRYLGL
jgi:hypothetical protein